MFGDNNRPDSPQCYILRAIPKLLFCLTIYAYISHVASLLQVLQPSFVRMFYHSSVQ